MFAILAANIVGGKLGYCAVPKNQSYYNINRNMVEFHPFLPSFISSAIP